MEHTKEPWSIKPCYEAEDCFDVMSNGKWFIATAHDGVNGQSNAEANARRIVACVNACAEISTATLENAGLDVGNELVKLRQQRDELQLERDNYKSVAEAHSGAFQECIRLREECESLRRDRDEWKKESLYLRNIALGKEGERILLENESLKAMVKEQSTR